MSANLMSLARSGGKFLKLFGDRKMVKTMPTARDYVQDGLIAMWDGIENAGWGVHVDSASQWSDLVHWVALKTIGDQISFGNDYGQSIRPFYGDTDILSGLVTSNDFTIEEVITPSPEIKYKNNFTFWKCGIQGNVRKECVYSQQGKYPYYYFINSSYVEIPMTDSGQRDSYVFSRDSNGVNSVYFKGVKNKEFQRKSGTAPSDGFVIGGLWSTSNNQMWTTNLSCLRLYNRKLTDAEVAANYAIDKARFNLKTPTI